MLVLYVGRNDKHHIVNVLLLFSLPFYKNAEVAVILTTLIQLKVGAHKHVRALNHFRWQLKGSTAFRLRNTKMS